MINDHHHHHGPDQQLPCQVWLKWKEEKAGIGERKSRELVKEAKHDQKPDGRSSLPKYFSSAHVEWYRISDQSDWRSYFTFHPPLYFVFRPRIVFELILHLFRTSLCFAFSPIIASWLHEMRTILKSNFIQSALKCIYGCVLLWHKWQPIGNLILFKAQQCWVSAGANRAMSLHWRN